MPKRHFLSPVQLESLTQPTRLAIAQRLEIDRKATARELAQRMGRPVTALYHHLKLLADFGVLHAVASRKGTRRPEAVYALAAEYLSAAQALKTPRGRKAYGRAASRAADAGVRALVAATAHGTPRFAGSHRDAMVRYYLLRADKKKLTRLNALLDELDGAATRSCENGEEIQLTILLSPVARKR